MPEGDTIFRAAKTLDLALRDRPVTRFWSVYPALTRIDEDAPIAGRIVTKVEARGKHLLMHFAETDMAPAVMLRTHMRMNGSWHIYRPGERWMLPRGDARIVVETADYVAVAFNVTVAEFLDEGQARRQTDLRLIGPDLLGETFDEQEAITRLRAHANEPIADALLNQRAIAGIGNVYKSEVLFLEGVHPELPVSAVPDETLRAILATSRSLLRVNVQDDSPQIITWRGLRRTTGRANPEERLWVYGRGGEPCRKCGTAISYKKIGRDVRGTYWCPACQVR